MQTQQTENITTDEDFLFSVIEQLQPSGDWVTHLLTNSEGEAYQKILEIELDKPGSYHYGPASVFMLDMASGQRFTSSQIDRACGIFEAIN